MTLNLNTLSTDDYSITFGSNPPSSISTVDLSTDAITVILTMNTPFGTGNTPFVEQIGDITDTFSNAVTLQSAIADDRAPPTLVSVDIIVTFSEKIKSSKLMMEMHSITCFQICPGVSVGIPLHQVHSVGAGWNRALADVNLISSSNIYLYKRRYTKNDNVLWIHFAINTS